jgi:hypothetical protein
LSDPAGYTDEDLYEVYFLAEVDALSNALRALARFKRMHGEFWPTKVQVSPDAMRILQFGQDMEFEFSSKLHRAAYYLSLYRPHYDPHNRRRSPSRFTGTRKAVKRCVPTRATKANL